MGNSFDIVFNSFSKNVIKSEQLLEKLSNEGNVLQNDALNMTINILQVQREFAITYGDKKAVEMVDKKIKSLEAQYGKDFLLSPDQKYQVTKEEMHDDINRVYDSNIRLMSNIFDEKQKLKPQDKNRQELAYTNVLIGEITTDFLTTQEMFVDSYFEGSEKDTLLDRISSKKSTLSKSIEKQEKGEFETSFNSHNR